MIGHITVQRQKGQDEDLAKVGGEVEVSQVAEGNNGGRLVANLKNSKKKQVKTI